MTDITDRLIAALADRYEVQRSLGSGGMATVYVAHDLKHDREVAIKVMREDVAAELGPERFLREINIVAHLNHPHILALHDSGEADGFLYYVMPYVEDESLRKRLDCKKQLAVDEAVRIVSEVADGLGYAHDHNVVHRDVKPGNILLEAGHAVIADFGIALGEGDQGVRRVTEQGAYIGTPEYMSPEQAMSERALDGRSDQYSLACVLYEMLVGQPPFVGSSPRVVLARHIADPVPPLATVRPGVADKIEFALARALSKEAADRFPSMAEFARALVAEDTAASRSPSKSIAVLAFANLSTDPEDEYLSDGLSDEIINALAKIEGFNVVSRTSSFAFKDAKEDIRAIGRRLNVRSVLEGSVRRSGDRLRVTAQLINVADGYHLWSDRYDREMKDVFDIEDEISENVARALEVVLSDDERRAIKKVPTEDVQAYDYYLRGRQFFYQFGKKSLEYARLMFTRAIQLDPDYALAHAGVADCCSFLYIYWGSHREDQEHAEAASNKALELGPDLAEAHAARGLAISLSKRYEEAAREFQTAIQLNPNLFEPYYFDARASFQNGEFERAARLFERAAEVRRDDYQAHFFAAQCYAAMGLEGKAEAAYRTALQAIMQHVDLNPDDARAVTMGAVSLCRLGEKGQGMKWADRALAIDPEDAGVSYNAACLFALEGEKDRAMHCLEDAVEGGFWHKEWAEKDPDLDSMRDDPRFVELMGQ